MMLLILLLIVLALLAGAIFLTYQFGDAVVNMLANLIGMPKGMIALLLLGIVLVLLSVKFIIKLTKHLERYE